MRNPESPPNYFDTREPRPTLASVQESYREMLDTETGVYLRDMGDVLGFRMEWDKAHDPRTKEPATEDQLKAVLGDVNSFIGVRTSLVFDAVDRAVLKHAAAAESLLGGSDQNVWQRVQAELANPTYSSDSLNQEVLSKLLNHASSEESRAAMKIALDQNVWQRVQAELANPTYGNARLNDEVLDKLLRYASTRDSRDAMKIALDQNVWQRVQAELANPTYGNARLNDEVLDKLLKRASTLEMRLTMANVAGLSGAQNRGNQQREYRKAQHETPRDRENRGTSGDSRARNNHHQGSDNLRSESRVEAEVLSSESKAIIDNRIKQLQTEGVSRNKIYQKLARENHPDMGGSLEAMKYVNVVLN